MTPREAFEAAAAAQRLGAEVYVVSGLLEALEGNRLLSRLFRAPVIRLRGSIETAKPYMLKRPFDVVGSAALLILCAPIIAVLGVLIRRRPLARCSIGRPVWVASVYLSSS